MKIQGNAVLILPRENKPKGIIIIPGTIKEPLTTTGKVVDVGDGVAEVKKGDMVLYPKKKASRIIIDDVEHHFVIEDQILIITGRNE